MLNYILRDENAIFFECGFSCDNALFIKLDKEGFFITDSRYTTQASEAVKNAEVIEAKRDLFKEATILLRENRIKKIYYDPTNFTVAQYNRLKQSLKTTFKPSANFSQKKRIIKTPQEIKLLQEAVKIGSIAFDAFADNLKNNALNKSEKYINFLANRVLTDEGQYDLSFEPITAVDENSAKPHAFSSDKRVKSNSLILFDAGVKYKRYCSDRTRVCEFNPEKLSFKKEQSFSDKKRQKIYDIVLKAQEEAIKAVKVGIKTSYIDKKARDVIEKAGYGKYFIHSTGHGVGLDIHELPTISKNSSLTIEENMVFTIEPGIYLPNEFGVRIEDMVVVTKDGAKVL